jgi:hypothetical protein
MDSGRSERELMQNFCDETSCKAVAWKTEKRMGGGRCDES